MKKIKQIFICVIVSVLLGLSIAFLMTRNRGYINKEPEEISLTDQLLIEANQRLLNIEKAIINLANQIEKSKFRERR